MEMWFSEFHTPDVKHSIRVNRQLYSRQSEYQRIDIFETDWMTEEYIFIMKMR